VSLEGFSWQDPFQSKTSSSALAEPPSPVVPPPPPPLRTSASYPPAGRNSSHGSLGMPPPHHNTSIGVPPPPPPDYYGRTSSDDRHHQFSSGRYESWGSAYACPSPPPAMIHQRSGGAWQGTPPPPQPHGPHQRSGSWTNGREHSLSHNPLANATVSQPASQSAFDSSRSSGSYWGPATAGPPIPPPPPPPPGPYGGPNGTAGQYRSPRTHTPSENNSPSPPGQYSFDINIAKTWSGGGSGGGSAGEMKRSLSGEQDPPRTGRTWSPPEGQHSPTRPGVSGVPRPHIVKRDTSNQNESYETKPMVKKANLNRDNSIVSKHLKEKYMPEYYNGKFDTEQEMRILSDNLEQSNLGMGMARPKPQPLSAEVRAR
jgi:hypothetical protein